MERRTSHRAVGKQRIGARVSGKSIKLTLLNLSVAGCKVRSKSAAIRKEASLTLILSGEETVDGTVVWRDAKSAGIRFDQNLSLESVLRFIQNGFIEPQDEGGVRDQFGRRLPGLSLPDKPVMAPSNLRVEERRDLECEAAVRLGYVREPNGRIINLSANGCLIKHGLGRLSIGARIHVSLPGFESFPGIVRWTDGCKAGVRFDNALHPAVVDLLVRRHTGDRRFNARVDAPRDRSFAKVMPI